MDISGILKGKKGVILGVANNRSIAWGITQVCSEAGAQIALSYQSEILKKRIEPLAQQLNIQNLYQCDVSNEKNIENLFTQVENHIGKIDFVVHAIAFSDKEELRGNYIDTSFDNFQKTMQISCYSMVQVAREASKIMNDSGSIISLSYYGAEKFIPHYNVMGVAKAALESSTLYLAESLGKEKNIRVNCISAGPVKTLAASGIGDMSYILQWNEKNSPLRKNVSIREIGNSALFLLSELASAVTGEVLHVDAGYHIMGMRAYDPDDKPDDVNKK